MSGTLERGISGNKGWAVVGSCTIAEFTDFQFTLDKGLKTYNSKSGAGWQKTQIGNKKVSGTVKGKYNSSDPIDTQLNTDSIVQIRLNFDSSPPKYFSGPGRFGQLEFTVNNDTGDIEEWSAPFESDGPWAFN
jgi:hypothetical protein